MKVDIIHSGSSGNCAIIDDVIAIDAGWRYDKISNLHAVFLTHHHTDHTKFLADFASVPIYCTAETGSRLLQGKFPYFTFNRMPNGAIVLEMNGVFYMIMTWLLKHDAPCVGYDITKLSECGENERIFFATDFNAIVDEERFVGQLKDKTFDALYIECNNTLTPADFHDVYFPEEGTDLPRDEFHRRKSYENHCNVNYLISLFQRAGYSPIRRFTEPVTLLHKSSYYYMRNVERIADLVAIANVKNPLYENK